MPTLGQPEAYIQVKDGFFDEAGNFANRGDPQVPARLDGQVRRLGEATHGLSE